MRPLPSAPPPDSAGRPPGASLSMPPSATKRVRLPHRAEARAPRARTTRTARSRRTPAAGRRRRDRARCSPEPTGGLEPGVHDVVERPVLRDAAASSACPSRTPLTSTGWFGRSRARSADVKTNVADAVDRDVAVVPADRVGDHRGGEVLLRRERLVVPERPRDPRPVLPRLDDDRRHRVARRAVALEVLVVRAARSSPADRSSPAAPSTASQPRASRIGLPWYLPVGLCSARCSST